MSPDGVHIMDSHPDYPNIVVGCGFSGKNNLGLYKRSLGELKFFNLESLGRAIL